ncbi:hypothetical protein F0562_028822 [Nyssa sinensis]|uniref:Legume lectin domain-containing protein n=1 Tax=Nyssa sinensis TaxID=561372 RepID=A0A5J5B164_9ASTE|nr:hypothetical protein F0562_028822 [Nyssa sinensis]
MSQLWGKEEWTDIHPQLLACFANAVVAWWKFPRYNSGINSKTAHCCGWLSWRFTDTTVFKFPIFDPNNHDILYEGDACASNNVIQLTTNQQDNALKFNGSVGRATYTKPVHLWDKASGNLADFKTHFSFVIDTQKQSFHGDGFAFFLAPNGSCLPNVSGGGGYTLTNVLSRNQALNSNIPFVAVEFDTFPNQWDTYRSDHVGINVNSTQSQISAPWLWSDIENGKRAEAWISYDSSSKNLSLLLTDDDDCGAALSSGNFTSLSYTIDLRENLPEWVTFGFSGSTNGSSFEIHNIITWNFSSSLQTSQTKNYYTPVFTSPPTPISSNDHGHDPERSKNKTWLWVVLGVVGCCTSVSGTALVKIYCCKSGKN